MRLRRIAAVIIILSVLASFAACSAGSEGKPDVTSPVTEAQDDWSDPDSLNAIYRERDDKVPQMDLGGREIHILSLKNKDYTGHMYDDEVSVKELRSEPINDAIYNRNAYVMDYLNCKITNEIHGYETVFSMLEKSHAADEDLYQVLGFEAAPSLSHAFEGYFINLMDMDESYLELDAPWWNQNFFDEVASGDFLCNLAGSISLSMIRSIYVTYFNKKIAEDENIGDLYQVVNEGKWTIDYQNELVSGMWRDLDGDSERSADDRYGYATCFYWTVDAYWASFDIDLLAKDTDGAFYFNLNEEKLYNSIEKIFALSWDNTGCYGKSMSSEALDNMFASGGTFMMSEKIGCAETAVLRNMQDDYGIIPMPKYDEKQKDYRSMPFEIFQTFAIPVTCADPAPVTAVLELMSAENWRKTIPIYSEVALKGKYLSDMDSRRMFDLITENVFVEAGLMYYVNLGDLPANVMRYPIERHDKDSCASNLTSKKRMVNFYIKALNERLNLG